MAIQGLQLSLLLTSCKRYNTVRLDHWHTPEHLNFKKYGLWIKKSHSGSVGFKGHQENISLAHRVNGNLSEHQLMKALLEALGDKWK